MAATVLPSSIDSFDGLGQVPGAATHCGFVVSIAIIAAVNGVVYDALVHDLLSLAVQKLALTLTLLLLMQQFLLENDP